MPTINEALGKESWTITARLVSKRVFLKERISEVDGRERRDILRMLSLLLIDENGECLDLITWNPGKIFRVHMEVEKDNDYLISGLGSFMEPNRNYSISKYLTRRWYIEPLEKKLRLRNYLGCTTSIDTAQRNLSARKGPQNVLATFISMTKGPIKYIQGRPRVKGWFVKMADKNKKEFYTLVWHPEFHSSYKFNLFNTNPGQSLLIVASRVSSIDASGFTGAQTYTLTTLYPPVVNSECVSQGKRRELLDL